MAKNRKPEVPLGTSGSENHWSFGYRRAAAARLRRMIDEASELS